MGGYGHRNMFYLTGMPGWMRFGYSPGWGGMPPGAQYLQATGQLGQFANWIGYPAGTVGSWPYYGGAPLSRDQELQALKAQKEALERQLEALAKRLEELEKGA